MTPPATVPQLHRESRFLCLPNAWDAASARRVMAAGAPFVATTSAAVAWSLGLRDGETLTPAQVLGRAREIRRACPDAALSIDIERGYSSDPVTVADFVDALVAAGVSGINIEDGTDEPALLAAKISAIRARHHRDRLFINARTDVYLAGLAPPAERCDMVLRRAQRYRDAGSDGLFTPALADEGEIARVVSATGLPLNLMALSGLPPMQRLDALGVRRLSAGPALAIVTYAHCESAARAFLAGTADALHASTLGFAEMDADAGPK